MLETFPLTDPTAPADFFSAFALSVHHGLAAGVREYSILFFEKSPRATYTHPARKSSPLAARSVGASSSVVDVVVQSLSATNTTSVTFCSIYLHTLSFKKFRWRTTMFRIKRA